MNKMTYEEQIIQQYIQGYNDAKKKALKQIHKLEEMIEKQEEQINRLYLANKKAIEYITSEESIETFKTIESREKWLKINHNLLNILQGEEK